MVSNINYGVLTQFPPKPDESKKKDEKAKQQPLTPTPSPGSKGDEVHFSGTLNLFANGREADSKDNQNDIKDILKDSLSPNAEEAAKGSGKSGAGKSEKDSIKNEPESPTFSNMNDRLNYVMSHFSEFDTAADKGGPDNKFSIKDLNALKDGTGDTAEVARGLINDDVAGKLGGKDGIISKDDIEGYQKANGGIIQVVDGIQVDTKGMDDKQIANAIQYINGLAADEDGKKLIKSAVANGPLTVRYETSFKDYMGATYSSKNRTFNMSKKMLDQEGGKDPTNIMGMTGFAHEFVHAATDNENHDSKMEESIATALGSRIAGRFYGKKVDSQQVFLDWIKPTGQTSSDAYKNLSYDNHIFEDLTSLGIDLSDFKKPEEPSK
jgi:hypothetical protein